MLSCYCVDPSFCVEKFNQLTILDGCKFSPKMHRPPIKCLLTFPQWRNKIICAKENFCMHWIIYEQIFPKNIFLNPTYSSVMYMMKSHIKRLGKNFYKKYLGIVFLLCLIYFRYQRTTYFRLCFMTLLLFSVIDGE